MWECWLGLFYCGSALVDVVVVDMTSSCSPRLPVSVTVDRTLGSHELTLGKLSFNSGFEFTSFLVNPELHLRMVEDELERRGCRFENRFETYFVHVSCGASM